MRTLIVLFIIVSGVFLSAFFLNTEYITQEKIHNAAELIGLEFTASEVDSLLDNVKEYQSDYAENRKISLPNSLEPALLFNPLPKGFEMPRNPDRAAFEIPENIQLPKEKDALAWYSIGALAALIRSGEISALELTQFFLDRLKAHDETLHCVITLTEKRALQQARKMDEELRNGQYRGPLHGIPFGVKDLFAVKGYKTTWGAEPFREQVIDEDATIVTKLEEAGGILCAKLTLGALAWGDVWYGEKTRNPWDPTQGSSGSSAGSASAVAAGLLPYAIGTETLGSIVSPSTVCGTTGLRPTFGRVSRHGAMALSWSMDKVGPICRSAEDCAIVLDAIRGKDALDPATMDAPFAYPSKRSVKNLRIGYTKEFFDNQYTFHAQDSAALEALQNAGLKLIPVQLPDYPDITFILQAEAAAAFDALTRSNRDDLMVRQIKNAWPNVLRSARFIPAVEYIQANRLRTKLIHDMAKLMEEIDVLVHPSWSSPVLRITNMTGHPTVSVPNGFRNGTPTSISFTGKLFREEDILLVAKLFQEKTHWDEKHPEGY